jgi:hypothetical protein
MQAWRSRRAASQLSYAPSYRREAPPRYRRDVIAPTERRATSRSSHCSLGAGADRFAHIANPALRKQRPAKKRAYGDERIGNCLYDRPASSAQAGDSRSFPRSPTS